MAPGADKTPDGLPVLIIKDIPPETPPGLAVAQPAVYYGEEDSGYRLVNTGVQRVRLSEGRRQRLRELSGPRRRPARQPAQAAGLRLARARPQHPDLGLCAPRQPDPALAPDPDPDRQDRAVPEPRSRSLSGPRRRAAGLDPGRLHDRRAASPMPSRPRHGISYIRNAVKVVVDAYQGDVDFYAVDPKDPCCRSMRRPSRACSGRWPTMPAGPQRASSLSRRTCSSIQVAEICQPTT